MTQLRNVFNPSQLDVRSWPAVKSLLITLLLWGGALWLAWQSSSRLAAFADSYDIITLSRWAWLPVLFILLVFFIEWVKKNQGMAFILPALGLWLFVGLYPVAMSVSLSFHRWNGFTEFSIFPEYVCQKPGCRYVEWQHFERILEPDTPPYETFMEAVWNNIAFMFYGTVGVIAISLPLALAMNNAVRGARIFRTLLLFPMATSGVAIYYVWKLIYQPDGILNSLLASFGLGSWVVEDGFLGDIDTALPALIAITIWAGVPFAMLLYLAGLQTIPIEVIEASIVDGANAFHRLRHIIWPLLRPITVIIIVLTFSGALQGFEMQLLMTNGGPTGHTNVVGLLVFNEAFGGWGTPDMGRASAYGWLLFVMGVGLSAITLRGMRTER